MPSLHIEHLHGFITEVVDDEVFFQAAVDIAEIIVGKRGRAVLRAFFVEDWLREDLIGGAGGADVGITVADVILLRHIVDYYSGNLIGEVIRRIHRHVVVYPEKYGFFFHEGCISTLHNYSR